MISVDRNVTVKTITANEWLKTPDNSIFPPNQYFCVVKGDFSQCSSFEVKLDPLPFNQSGDIPFDEFDKIGDKIVGDGYIILFTKGLERPCCLTVRFAKRCLRL